ncbi:MAG: pilus assembly protein [Bacilli bacterium]|nr:pilus assembly protein [Bacilli bacterium]MDD4808478.1 pilus assembly protein [Bacilli bacterium]
MNKNKGQVLVVFILLIPILFMLATIFIDLGLIFMEKRQIDNVVKDTIKYGVSHLSTDNEMLKNDLREIITSNIDDIDNLIIEIENEVVRISLNKKKDVVFSIVFNRKSYDIVSSYMGYISSDKLIIRKD